MSEPLRFGGELRQIRERAGLSRTQAIERISAIWNAPGLDLRMLEAAEELPSTTDLIRILLVCRAYPDEYRTLEESWLRISAVRQPATLARSWRQEKPRQVFEENPVRSSAGDKPQAWVPRPGARPAMSLKGSDSATVFLCHSWGDKEKVRELYDRLTVAGVNCWFDEEDILPGQRWQPAIAKAIRESKYVLACLSEASINRAGYVQKELKSALDVADMQPEDSIYLIPVRLEECAVPSRLADLQWVDLFRQDGYRRLLAVLTGEHG